MKIYSCSFARPKHLLLMETYNNQLQRNVTNFCVSKSVSVEKSVVYFYISVFIVFILVVLSSQFALCSILGAILPV